MEAVFDIWMILGICFVLSALKIPNQGISVSLGFNMVDDSTRINHSSYDHLSNFSYKQNLYNTLQHVFFVLNNKTLICCINKLCVVRKSFVQQMSFV